MNKQNFDAMGKEQLRQACRDAGISYGKMDNAKMRAALANAASADATVKVLDSVTKADVAKADHTLPKQVVPQEQIDRAEVKALSKVDAPKSEPVAAPAAKRTSNGVKIDKGREEQNGVKRPSAGTICRAIWDQLDTLRFETNATPTFEQVRALMATNNWQKNTAVTQYQRWKEFNGLMPRSNGSK